MYLHTDAQDLSWNAGKKFMGNVDGFLKSLQSFDKDNIPMICVDKVSTWGLRLRAPLRATVAAVCNFPAVD